MMSMEKIGSSMAKTIKPTTAPTARIIDRLQDSGDQFGRFIDIRLIAFGDIPQRILQGSRILPPP